MQHKYDRPSIAVFRTKIYHINDKDKNINSNQMKRKTKKYFRLNQKQREIFNEVARYALAAAITGTALAIIITAPNLLQVLGSPLKKKYRWGELKDDEIKPIIKKLYKDKLVQTVEKKGKTYLQITGHGKRKIIEYNIDTIEIKKQKWDGKWRMVIFDIPEKTRIARDVLRDKLQEIGFLKLQKSVWVAPYECENEINFIASVYGVEKFVNYAVCEKIDNGKSLQKLFDLN